LDQDTVDLLVCAAIGRIARLSIKYRGSNWSVYPMRRRPGAGGSAPISVPLPRPTGRTHATRHFSLAESLCVTAGHRFRRRL